MERRKGENINKLVRKKFSSLAIVAFISSLLLPLYFIFWSLLSALGFSDFANSVPEGSILYWLMAFGLIFLYAPFIGLICGIISLINIHKNNLKGKWLAIVAIIISILSLVWYIIGSIFLIT